VFQSGAQSEPPSVVPHLIVVEQFLFTHTAALQRSTDCFGRPTVTQTDATFDQLPLQSFTLYVKVSDPQ
jgi:hypothetical protein